MLTILNTCINSLLVSTEYPITKQTSPSYWGYALVQELYYLEVYWSLSITELCKHKQNDVFQSYRNDRIKVVDTETQVFHEVLNDCMGMMIRP